MKNYLTIIFGLSLYPLLLISNDEYKPLYTNSDDKFEILTPDKYFIAIEYPKPEPKEVNPNVEYTALGVLAPEEIEEVTIEEKKCFPNAYSDTAFNKKRATASILSAGIAFKSISY